MTITFLDVANSLAKSFDFDLARSTIPFVPFDLRPVCADPFRLGLIVGPSGSGKTQALKLIGDDMLHRVEWSERYCVADHFATTEQALKSLAGAGLNSVPQWMKPRHLLSNGEQYRADFARVLDYMSQCASPTCVDEFTSVVDRTVARSLCDALTRFLYDGSQLVLATCHYDVNEWLNPDWVLDTSTNTMTIGAAVHGPKSWEIHVFEKVGSIVRG